MDEAKQAKFKRRKSEFMVIGHSTLKYSMNGLEEIEVNQMITGRATKTNYLGFNIEEKFSSIQKSYG